MNIAIVGATGLVGKKMLDELIVQDIEYDKVYLFASKNSAGKTIIVDDKDVEVEELSKENIENKTIDFCLIATGNKVSENFSQIFIENGGIVIDNSSRYRMDEEVPLVIPEINFDSIGDSKLIANPNCSTIQMLQAVYPLYIKKGIKEIFCSTYQSISGAGTEALNEYYDQVDQFSKKKDLLANKLNFPIQNNLIPKIDKYIDSEPFEGYTKEEVKMIEESKKILANDDIFINSISVRVPIDYCHSESIFLKLENQINNNEVEEIFNGFEYVKLLNDTKNNLFPMPYYLHNTDKTYVGRVKIDGKNKNQISLWAVADNLTIGAATNAVRILKKIINK